MSMLKEYWLLLKLHLKMRIGFAGIKATLRTGRGKAKMFGFAFLVLYVVAAVWLLLFLILNPLMEVAVQSGMGTLIFGMMIMATMLIALFLGTLSLLGLVFNAKDTELYAALPVRQSSVFAAKFSMVYLTELAFALFFLLPTGIVYTMHAGFDLWFWIKFPFIVMLVPVFPLVISCLLAFPLMLLTARSRRRDTVMLILSIVLMLALVVGQVYLQTTIQSLMLSQEDILTLLNNPDGLISVVLGAFPPAMWAAQALLYSGTTAVTGFLLFLATSAVSFILACLISSKLYYRGALAQLESAKKGKSRGYSAGHVKSGKPAFAFMRKELRAIIRTPVYAMNQLTTVIIIPLMLVIFRFMPGDGAGLDEIFSMLDGAGIPPAFTTLLISGILGFVLLINPQATTTFSRDGVSIFYIKSLPVPVATQMAGRIMAASVTPLLSVLVIELLLYFWLGVDILVVVSSALIALSAVALTVSAAMIPDCAKPKLRWNSEAEAMKQNMNSMFGMLTALLSLVPAIVLAILLYNLGVALPIITAALMILNGLLTFGAVPLAGRVAGGMLENLES